MVVYLNEDVASGGWDNVGEIGNIWINPACDPYTDESGISRVGNNGTCDTRKITSYFELARSTEEVNAELNSQHLVIPATTYRYVRVQLCDNQIDDKNVRFTSVAGGLTTPLEVRTGFCVMTPVPIDPPLTLAENESAVVSLEYDLSTVVVDNLYNVATGIYNTRDQPIAGCVNPDILVILQDGQI